MNVASLFATLGFKVEAEPLDHVSEQLEGIKSRLEFLGGVEILRGIFELTESYSGFAEQLGVAATSAGLTVEALQKIQYAAGLAGVTSEDVSNGLARLTRSLYAARKGDQAALDAFKEAGIGAEQLKTFKTSREAMLALGDALKTTTDPIKRQAIVLGLMGRGAANMVEFLASGSEEIERLGTKAERMGAIISGDTIHSLREMEDAFGALKVLFKAFAATVAGGIAPAMTAFADTMSEVYANYHELILTNAKSWFNDLLYNLGFLTGVLLGLAANIMDFIDEHPKLVAAGGPVLKYLLLFAAGAAFLDKMFGLVKGSLMALVTPFRLVGVVAAAVQSFFADLILNIAVLVSVWFPAIGDALLAAAAWISGLSIGWVIAIIAGITVAVHDLWVILTGGKWEDTWIAQLLTKGAKGFAWLADKLGFSTKLIMKMQGMEYKEDSTDAVATGTGPLRDKYAKQESAPYRMNADGEEMITPFQTRDVKREDSDLGMIAYPDDPEPTRGAKIDAMVNALERTNNVAEATAKELEDMRKLGPYPRAPENTTLAPVREGDRSITINNNVNLAVTGTPEKVGNEYKKAVKDVHDTTLRQAHESVKGVLVH